MVSDILVHERALIIMDSLLFLNACVFIVFGEIVSLLYLEKSLQIYLFFGPLANLIHNKLKVLANIELSK